MMIGCWTTLGIALILGVDPNLPKPDQVIEVSNGSLFRRLVISAGVLQTTSWGRVGSAPSTIEPLPSSGEFRLLLAGRSRSVPLSNRDFHARLVEPRVPSIETEPNQPAPPVRSCTFELSPRHPNDPTLQIRYEAVEGKNLLRKSLTVQSKEVILELDVESLDLANSSDGGGLGLPLFVQDSWFLGIEHPTAENTRQGQTVALRHWPTEANVASKTSVLGTGMVDEPIREAFLRYVDEHRPRHGSFLLMSTWFHARGKDLNPTTCLDAAEFMQKHYLEPFGVKLDAFLIDDGYQNPKSLWLPGDHWPEGFAPLVDQLRKRRSALGLWMPLNGLGLDWKYGQAQGWKIAQFEEKKFYSLTDPNYEKLLRQTMDDAIDRWGVTCFKHDFNILEPDTTDPPLPSREATRERIADATIRLLDGSRRRKPDIFLSLTSGVNLSPWWLWHADSLWMGHGDYSHDWSFPQSSDRHAEMTYRDEKLYRRLRIDKLPIPPSALMTHGVIRGLLDHTDPPLRRREEWNDYVVWTLGRGTELQELYVSPRLLVPGDQAWPHVELAKALGWARENATTFAHTVLVGGNPGKGEAHGYIHWSDRMGIAVFRNPGITPVDVDITLAERPFRMEHHPSWKPFIVYSRTVRIADWDTRRPLRLTLPSQSVSVVHLYQDVPQAWSTIPPGHFAIDSANQTITLQSPIPSSVAPGSSVIDEQTEWRGEVVASGIDKAKLLVSSQHARGIALTATPSLNVPVYQRSAPGWSLDEYDLIDPSLSLHAFIGATPLFPEQSRATAVFRGTIKLAAGEIRPIDGTLPAIPSSSFPQDEFVLERTLFENRLFTRGRKLIERWAWWMAMIVLPQALLLAAEGRIGRHWPSGVRWLVRGAIVGSFGLVYLATPAAEWLVNLLIEEM